jgi:hypothetical protein
MAAQGKDGTGPRRNLLDGSCDLFRLAYRTASQTRLALPASAQ